MSLGSADALIAGKKHVGRIKAYVRDAGGRRFVGSVPIFDIDAVIAALAAAIGPRVFDLVSS